MLCFAFERSSRMATIRVNSAGYGREIPKYVAVGARKADPLLLSPRELFTRYSNSLIERPFVTKIITGFIVGCLGDCLIQLIGIHKGGAITAVLDRRRLAVFATVVGFYISPVIHVWFDFLNNIPLLKGLSKIKKSLVMLFIDQTVGALLVNGGFFFAFELAQSIYPPYSGQWGIVSVLSAGQLSLYKNLWKTLLASWTCWPFINLLNFYVIPTQFQVLFANFAAIFWNMFLSAVANSA